MMLTPVELRRFLPLTQSKESQFQDDYTLITPLIGCVKLKHNNGN